MTAAALNRPDATDLTIADIDPAGELKDCNHLLEDHAALAEFYEDNGYIPLRNVLDLDSIAQARDAMLKITSDLGATVPGDSTAKWTGKPMPSGLEESELFSGIAGRLMKSPHNLDVMHKVLGEPVRSVPIVQYRTYVPNQMAGIPHQDGFYVPGVQDYKPVWITLTPCSREMGGLAIAVGQNKRGYFHNVAKRSPYPIPRDAIPDDCWATTDYRPGDVLIVHPATPHTGMANRSDRLRISLDTRVQSDANPSAIAAIVRSATPDSLTVDADGQGDMTFRVDEDTFIRPFDPGVRERLEGFADYMKPDMRLVVVRDGDRAVMLRKSAEG